jgi:parvulin-like peptidyl-prolyl isomerase
LPNKNDERKDAQSQADADVTKTPAKPKRAAKADKPAAKTPAPKVSELAAKAAAKDTATDAPAAQTATVSTAQSTKSGFNPMSMPMPDLKKLALRVLVIVVALVAVVTLVFGVMIYAYKSEDQVTRTVSHVIPYPAEKVNGSFVSYGDYLFEVEANKRAYQNNAKLNNQPAVDFNSADGKKLVIQIKQHALDKLKSDAVIAQLASQKKVKVSDKEINDLLNELYKRYGGKDTLLKTLNQIYGWNMGDLHSVVYKQLLAKKLEEKVTADPALDAQAKTKAQDVLSKVKAGGDFGELAKQYSQSSDASTGGDLGNFTKGQLPDEVQKAADALQPGQVSDAVKTQYGYEIIKVLDKSGESTHAQHILIPTIDYTNYFNDQLNKAKVNTYIKA